MDTVIKSCLQFYENLEEIEESRLASINNRIKKTTLLWFKQVKYLTSLKHKNMTVKVAKTKSENTRRPTD